jgi:hypothetical protein
MNICSCGGPRRGVKYSIDADYNEVLAGTLADDKPSPLTLAYGLQFHEPLKSITAIKKAMCRKVRVCVCVCVCVCLLIALLFFWSFVQPVSFLLMYMYRAMLRPRAPSWKKWSR